MSFINFYEKYGISQNENILRIQSLIEQELMDEKNDSFSSGHSERMSMLEQAQKVFSSENSRIRYDKELSDSLKRIDPNDERKENFQRYYNQAKEYYNSRNYDLAKTAIDRALSYVNRDKLDSSVFCNASKINTHTLNFNSAIEYANQAIVVDSDNYLGYSAKIFALDSQMNSKNISNSDKKNIWDNLMSTIDLMISKAEKSGNNNSVAMGYDLMAQMHYVYVDGKQYPITGANNEIAERCALKALSLIENNRNLKHSSEIISDITGRRRQIEKFREDIAQLNNSNNNLTRLNEELRNKIIESKESINNRTYRGDTEIGKEYWWLLGLLIFQVFGLILAIVILILRVSTVEKNRNINHTLQFIRDSESTINGNIHQIKNNNDLITDINKRITLYSSGLSATPIKL
jgi:tetratricopeptide (TPR) repeat protein